MIYINYGIPGCCKRRNVPNRALSDDRSALSLQAAKKAVLTQ